MSVGFSFGEFISVANLAHRLVTALRETRGGGKEYRDAIDELGCHQVVLMRVSHLERNDLLPPATLHAASHMVKQSMNIIHDYLEQTKKYDNRLGRNGVSGFRHGVSKVRWTLLKADDMRKLTESLQRRNAGLQLLLQCAHLEKDNPFPQHISDNKQLDASDPPPANCRVLENSTDSALKDGLPGKVASEQPERQSNLPSVEEIPSLLEDITGPPPSSLFSLSSFTAEQLRFLISSQKSRESEILAVADLLRTLTRLGDYQLPPVEHRKLAELLDNVCQDPKNPTIWAPIKFKDAVGRKFSFPWDLCRTWKGIEELINQAFLHVEILGPHVHQGHYDLVGPDGEIVLPQVWETMVQPGWSVTMHMWPIPKPRSTQTEPLGGATPVPQASPYELLELDMHRQTQQRRRSQRATMESVADGSIKAAKPNHDKHLNRKNRDESKRRSSSFFAWAAGKRSNSPHSSSESSVWTSSAGSRSASDSEGSSMASSPAVKDRDIEASAAPSWDSEGDGARLSIPTSPPDTPVEAAVEMGAQMRSESSEILRFLDPGNEDAPAQFPGAPDEGLSSLLHSAAKKNTSLQAHVGDCDEDASI